MTYLRKEELQDCPQKSKKLAAKAPQHLRQSIIEENYQGPMAGHFAGERLYKALARHWWWQNMYMDVVSHCVSCPQCAIVNSSGRVNRPPLHPIPVQRVFQIVGVDVMDLPRTVRGNKYVQDFVSKWPLVFPVPDQKAQRLARLLVEEVMTSLKHFCPTEGQTCFAFDVRCVSADGNKEAEYQAYHPQCDGMVERFNRTLKTILR